MVENLTELVEKSMKGDKKAFEELIARKQREILYITSHFCKPQDLEDYAQEALLLMYKKLDQLRDPSCFNDWMYNIIRNTCFYYNRKKLKHSKIAEITPFDPASDGMLNSMEEDRNEFLPVEYLERKEKKSEVMDAINGLPEHYRNCLLLFFYEGMSYDEIARALETTPKNVSNYLFRAKQLLKKRLNLAIEKHEIFSISAVPAVPILTQIFREDANAKIPQELCDKMVNQTVGKLAKAGAAQGAAAKTVGSTLASKAAVGIVSALAITGVALGTVYYVNQDKPGTRLEAANLQSVTPQVIGTVKQTAKSLVKSIDTLADMIGKDYLKKLMEYEKNGVSKEDWVQFIQDIEAKEKTRTESAKGDIYTLYVLEKQDKQLLMVTREGSGDKKLQVRYEFGAIQEIPDMIHFIMLFR